MKVLLALLKIVAISAPLTWLWIEWGRAAYGRLFLQLALPIYGLLGLTTLIPDGERDRFINYLPFLVLMLITPRMTVTRRVVGLAAGFVVIFFVHLLFVYIASTAIQPGGAVDTQGFKKLVAANQLADSVPFILWVVIAREFVWEQTAGLFKATQTTPEGEDGA
jgi:hypothetical protein